jgi:hypothetical protein
MRLLSTSASVPGLRAVRPEGGRGEHLDRPAVCAGLRPLRSRQVRRSAGVGGTGYARRTDPPSSSFSVLAAWASGTITHEVPGVALCILTDMWDAETLPVGRTGGYEA